MGKEKPNIGEYPKWLEDNLDCKIPKNYKTYYETVINAVKLEFEKSDIWTSLLKNLEEYNDEYNSKTGYPLFIDFQPELDVKTYKSFFEKTYRKNILENNNWPKPPDEGWLLPDNWYSKINDIIRTCLVVQYIDGIEFMMEKLKSLCKKNGNYFDVDYEARIEGYYAVHTYTKINVEIPKEDWNSKDVVLLFEIQITSQLQEIIKEMLHIYYKKRRHRLKTESEIIWQWDYKSDEFATNYLGHILHYLEAMIYEIREKQKEVEEIEK